MATAIPPKPIDPFETNPWMATPPATAGAKLPPAGPQAPGQLPTAPPRPAGITAAQRQQRAADWGRGLDYGQNEHGGARGRREIEEGDRYYKTAVLGDLLAGGHMDPLDNDWAYSFRGAGPEGQGGEFVFADRSGRETSGTAAQRAAARADMAQWVNEDGTPASGPPGGGAGGGSGPSSEISDMIKNLMSGQLGPYDAESIARMKAAAFDETAGGVEASKRDAGLRARRGGGLYGAGSGSNALAIERSGRSDIARANSDIGMKATEANFDSRMQGLQAGLEQLKGERDERMANARNAVEREQIASQYKGLMDSTNAKIKAEMATAQKGYDAERASGAAARDFAREQEATSWDRELNRRGYEEPFRISGLQP